MWLDDLKISLDVKEAGVLDSLISNKGEGVDYSFREFDMMFKTYNKCKTDADKRTTPERHLLNMFKLIYVSYGIINLNVLPLLTTIYLIRTKSSLYRVPRVIENEKSVYAKVVGKDVFNLSVKRFRVIYKSIKTKSKDIPIDSKKGVMLSIESRRFVKTFPDETVFKISSDPNRIKLFDDKVKSGKPAFIVKDNILHPYTEPSNDRLEDFDDR